MFSLRDKKRDPLTPTFPPRGEGALARHLDGTGGILANSVSPGPSKLSIDAIQGAAGRLLNEAVCTPTPIGGGRNSQVYRLTTAGGREFALKIYFQHPSDPRDRLGTEFNGLRFLWQNGVRDIAEPLFLDRAHNMALYAYIIGESATSCPVTEADIDDAVGFLAKLEQVKTAPGSETLAGASEACFSIEAIIANLHARMNRLLQVGADQTCGPELESFFQKDLLPGLKAVVSWCESKAMAAEIDPDKQIPRAQRTLSPSDFGFHNAVRRPDGRLAYVDFEYFGWDDPAKMIADVLLHPGMALDVKLKRRFATGMLSQLTDIPSLARRVEMVYPLFAIKWCLILLNEFLPENLMRRRFACTATATDPAAQVRRQQLSKAIQLWQTVRNEYERFPYLT